MQQFLESAAAVGRDEYQVAALALGGADDRGIRFVGKRHLALHLDPGVSPELDDLLQQLFPLGNGFFLVLVNVFVFAGQQLIARWHGKRRHGGESGDARFRIACKIDAGLHCLFGRLGTIRGYQNVLEHISSSKVGNSLIESHCIAVSQNFLPILCRNRGLAGLMQIKSAC